MQSAGRPGSIASMTPSGAVASTTTPSPRSRCFRGGSCRWSRRAPRAPGEPAIRGDDDLVGGCSSGGPVPRRAITHLLPDVPVATAMAVRGGGQHAVVGMERSAERDVDHLHAPADPEHRDAGRDRLPGERQLGLVAHRRVCGRSRVVATAEALRLDVAATREHKPVEPRKQRCRSLRVGQDHRDAAEVLDRDAECDPEVVAVVGEPTRDTNQRGVDSISHTPREPTRR